ncbi:tRNA lysidine(34) synthetase TilS [bacterium]|nr:tRNA lysidine(34) synthetase TilS [bacterium]
MNDDDSKILEQIEKFTFQHNLWDADDTVIAAVSGGSDSVFMLMILRELSKMQSFDLRAIHINHLLRGEESDGDEIFVADLCKKWKIPLNIYRVNIADLSEKFHLGIEETARNRRLKIFADESKKYNGVIALAHTADDIVETFLFNLIRGTGIRGLSAIEPKRNRIVRPILPIWREQIIAVLRSHNIYWREDSSNLELKYSRNHIRNELVPFIKLHFGKDSIEHIESASEMIRTTKYALQRCFRMRHRIAFIGECDGIVSFQTDETLTDPFTFGELLRQVLIRLGIGLKRFSKERVERLFNALLIARPNNRITIYSGVFAVKTGDSLIFADHRPIQIVSQNVYVDEPISLDGGLGEMKIEIVSPNNDFGNISPFEAYLGYDGQEMSIRPYRNGMYFKPLSNVSMRLSKFLKNRGVPAIFRKALPLFFIGKKLAWVGGVEISEQFKIDNNTKNVVHIKWDGSFTKILSKSIKHSKNRKK